jgi:hypothetical protein
LFIREPAPQAPFAAVLYDLDSLPPDDRRRVVEGLLAGRSPSPAAVHSYGLEEGEAEALRARGVAVFGRLDGQAVAGLVELLGRAPAEAEDAVEDTDAQEAIDLEGSLA